MSKKKKTILLIFLGVLILLFTSLLIFIAYFKANVEDMPPSLKLKGNKIQVVKVNEDYKEEGVKASFKGKDVSKDVDIKGNIDTKKVGTYEVIYSYTYKFIALSKSIKRTVLVVDDISPELKINSNDKITININDSFTPPTATATDNYDGDISDKIAVENYVNTKTSGTYEVKYTVEDSSGNTVSKSITVVVSGRNPRIDIYISQQKLYYYEYGSVVLTSDVVTGINNGTPTGHYRILNKARNATLKGRDYESHVSYWIAFIGSSYGLHDASWRSSFGGSIYKTNGSHGCVNMPYYKVQYLYNNAPIGTPVNIYP